MFSLRASVFCYGKADPGHYSDDQVPRVGLRLDPYDIALDPGHSLASRPHILGLSGVSDLK